MPLCLDSSQQLTSYRPEVLFSSHVSCQFQSSMVEYGVAGAGQLINHPQGREGAPQGGEGGRVGRQMGRVLLWGLTADASTQGQLLTGVMTGGRGGWGQCSMENMFRIKMSHVSVVREALQLCLSPVSHSVVPICLLIVLSVCLHFLSPSHTTRPVSTGVVSV